MMGFYLVAVHGGAGFHEQSETSDTELKKTLRLACKEPIDCLSKGDVAVEIVSKAICILEDSSCLNAGYGSNLSIDGTVECDASIMDGRSEDYGSVGAVSGVKNPIKAAQAILQHPRTTDPLGRIPPLLLVGERAASFSRQQGIECVPPEALICPRASHEWDVWKTRLETSQTTDEGESWDATDLRKIQDTVGALAWDRDGNLAAGVSSGGLLLKHSGRVGEAAVYGAGCWASQRSDSDGERGVACSVSGSGEYIVRAALARTIGESIMASPDADTHDILQEALSNYHEMCYNRGEKEPSAGLLLLVQEHEEDERTTPRLWCAFTTHSMAIAYASSLDSKPRAMILRRPVKKGAQDKSVYITALSLTR